MSHTYERTCIYMYMHHAFLISILLADAYPKYAINTI